MSRNRKETPVGDWWGSTVPDAQIEHSLGDAVRDAIETLEEPHREALLMYFYERMTLAEMAKEWGLASKQGAYDRRVVAQEALRVALAEEGVDYGGSE